MSSLKKEKIGKYIELLTDYHSNGSYESLKKNVTLLSEKNYAVMIRTLNFERNDFNNDLIYVDKEAYEHLSKSKVMPNDILTNKIANPGSIYIMPDLHCPVTCGMNLFLIRFSKEVNQRYMYYCMKNSESYIKSFAHGTTTKTITKDEIKNIDLLLHDNINEQNKIEKLLTTIDKKIECNTSIIDNLDNVLNLLYNQWFVQFDFPNENGNPYKTSGGQMVWNDKIKRFVPVNWDVIALKNQYKLERGISYSSKDIEKGIGIPMINLGSIDTQRNYKPNELKYFNSSVPDKYLLSKNDLLIACTDMTRNADIVGCPILVPCDNIEYTYTMDMAKITPINENINKYYLYMTLRTDFYHKYIKKWASGTNVLHLNLSGLDWYTIWLPPLELQQKFADFVQNINDQKSKIFIENNKLSSLRNYLLPLLMNGQATIED